MEKKKKFTTRDAEKLVKASLGEDVFRKKDGEIKGNFGVKTSEEFIKEIRKAKEESEDPYEIEEEKITREEIDGLYAKAIEIETEKNGKENINLDISELKNSSGENILRDEDKLDEKKALENSVKQISFFAKQLKGQIDEDCRKGKLKNRYKIVKTLTDVDWGRFNGKRYMLKEIFVKAQEDVDSYLKSKKNTIGPKSLGAAAEEIGGGSKKNTFDGKNIELKEGENKIEKFSEFEMELIEIYKEDVKEIIKFIKDTDYVVEYGFDEKEVEGLIVNQIERFWNKFYEEMIEENKFSSREITEEVLGIIKKESGETKIVKTEPEALGEKKELVEIEEITEEKDDPARAASWHTIYKLENSPDLTYKDLDGLTKEERDQKFTELTRRLWDEFAVHGFAEKDLKTGGVKIKRESDLDGRGFLKLLELAGIKVDQEKINYINKGETAESGIIGDTSDENGVVAMERGRKLVIDHHSKYSDRSTSTTKFTYEMLVKMNLLKKEKYLDKFVEFVTKCDNENFTDAEDKEIFENYSKNLYGIRDKLKTEEVLELFKKGVDPVKNLPVDYLKEHKYMKAKEKKTLLDFSGELKANKKKAEKKIDELEKEGFFLDTGDDRFGKILIDTKTKKPDGRWFAKIPQIAYIGRLAVRVKGFGGYIIWSDNEKSFVLYTKKKMDEVSIPGGFSDKENVLNIRGYMLVKSANSTKPLEITLEDILGKLSGKADFKIEGKLKEVIEKEKEERANTKPSLVSPQQPLVPESVPQLVDKKQENISNSVNKLTGLFSDFELSYDALKEEADKIQVSPAKLAVSFIEGNDELRSLYKDEVRKGSIDEQDDNKVEKLAMTVILKDEKKKVEEKIKNEGENDALNMMLIEIESDLFEIKRIIN